MAIRNPFEAAVGNHLDRKGVAWLYETARIPYLLDCKYLPDFLLQNNVYLEVKGYFSSDDRRKMKNVIKQHPELDIRMVFQRNSKLNKNSKVTYGAWCDKLGIKWCVYPNIPEDWIHDSPTQEIPGSSEAGGD
jgi:hypothetical protein